MLRKLIVLAAVGLLPAIAQAHFRQGDWDLTVSGSGANGPDFNGMTASANVGLGYLLTDNLEAGVRQSLTFTDIGVGGDLNGSTRIFGDFHFPLGDRGQWQPFVGANIGYVYGDAVHDSWEAAPEGGVKYFLNETTYLGVMVEYQFFFDTDSSAGQAFSDGQFIYSLMLGVRL